MERLTGVLVAALMLGAAGCGTMPEGSAESEPSPVYAGPVWEAYAAGRDFGRENRDTARVPTSVAHTTSPGADLAEAVQADSYNARWWCRRNLPDELTTDHQAHADDLLAGCMAGTIPSMDQPELYAQNGPFGSREEEQ